jgi:hypothetical protein
MPFLAPLSLILGAVGAGVSYVSAQNAAKTQETLALLNAQAQSQSINQQGQINQMQAAINTRLAEKDKEAADENARMLASQAELGTRASMDAIRHTRAEAAKFASLQVASLAKGGYADTSGSPLRLQADTMEHAQEQADIFRFEDEQSRRLAFRDVSIAKNQGVLAGLNVGNQRLAGLAAQQQTNAALSQSRMNYHAERATASAMRTRATGSLLNSLGGLAWQGYQYDRNRSGTA